MDPQLRQGGKGGWESSDTSASACSGRQDQGLGREDGNPSGHLSCPMWPLQRSCHLRPVLVSWGSHNTVPQTRLQSRQLFSQSGGQRSDIKVLQDSAPSGAWRRPAVAVSPPRSLPRLHLTPPVSVSFLSLSVLQAHLSLDLRSTWVIQDDFFIAGSYLNQSMKILSPNKVLSAGFGVWRGHLGALFGPHSP